MSTEKQRFESTTSAGGETILKSPPQQQQQKTFSAMESISKPSSGGAETENGFVLVFGPSDRDERVQRQRQYFTNAGFESRGIKIGYIFTQEHQLKFEGFIPEGGVEMKHDLKVPDSGFRVVLLGPSGFLNSSWENPIESKVVLDEIEATIALEQQRQRQQQQQSFEQSGKEAELVVQETPPKSPETA